MKAAAPATVRARAPIASLLALATALGLATTTAAAAVAGCADAAALQQHDDGTLTDTRSGLMWMRCSTGQALSAGRCAGEPAALSWTAARAAAAEVNRRGDFFFNDWRLPKVHELATIADVHCDRLPRIDPQAFPDTPADFYWTGSNRRGETRPAAFVLSFGAAGVGHGGADEAHFVRLVRSAR